MHVQWNLACIQKNVNESGLPSQCCKHRFAIDKNFVYTSVNKFLFLTFQLKHNSVIARVVSGLRTQFPGPGHIAAAKLTM